MIESEEIKILTRFWSKVIDPGDWDVTKCFIWNRSLDKDGYGRFYYEREHKAHRFLYNYYFGPIPDNLNVCHRCNNPSCVNLTHLYLATQKENMEYSSECCRNGNSKLDGSDVLTILNGIDDGTFTSVTQIMNVYNISRPNIHEILRGNIWRSFTKKYYSDFDLERLSKIVIRRTLTEIEVQDIKQRIKNGEVMNHIAKLYGVDFKSIKYYE